MRSGSRRSRYSTRIETKVEAVGVDVVQVEQQIAARGGHHRRDPFDLRAIAGRRIHQRRDVLDHRACDPTIDAARDRLAAVASIVAPVRGAAARWPISMSPARTHARCSDQNAGFNAIDEPREPVETTGINRCRRCRAERDAVHEERHLMRERLERTRRARRGAELLLGDDLDDVDAIEVGEDPGRERRLPRQAEAIVCPPQRTSRASTAATSTSPPQLLPPPPQLLPLDESHIQMPPHEDVLRRRRPERANERKRANRARHRSRTPPSAAPARSVEVFGRSSSARSAKRVEQHRQIAEDAFAEHRAPAACHDQRQHAKNPIAKITRNDTGRLRARPMAILMPATTHQHDDGQARRRGPGAPAPRDRRGAPAAGAVGSYDRRGDLQQALARGEFARACSPFRTARGSRAPDRCCRASASRLRVCTTASPCSNSSSWRSTSTATPSANRFCRAAAQVGDQIWICRRAAGPGSPPSACCLK